MISLRPEIGICLTIRVIVRTCYSKSIVSQFFEYFSNWSQNNFRLSLDFIMSSEDSEEQKQMIDNKSKKWSVISIGSLFRPKKQQKEKQTIIQNVESGDRRIFKEDMRTPENMNDRFHDSPKEESKTKRNSIDYIKDLKIGTDLEQKTPEKQWTPSEEEVRSEDTENDRFKFRSIDTLMRQMKSKRN